MPVQQCETQLYQNCGFYYFLFFAFYYRLGACEEIARLAKQESFCFLTDTIWQMREDDMLILWVGVKRLWGYCGLVGWYRQYVWTSVMRETVKLCSV